MEKVSFVEHDQQELRLRGKLPHCFFCGGDMFPVPGREKSTWKCKNCASVLRQGYPQAIVNNIVKGDLYNIEKSRRQGHGGGNKSGRVRKKDTRKRKTYDFLRYDA